MACSWHELSAEALDGIAAAPAVLGLPVTLDEHRSRLSGNDNRSAAAVAAPQRERESRLDTVAAAVAVIGGAVLSGPAFGATSRRTDEALEV